MRRFGMDVDVTLNEIRNLVAMHYAGDFIDYDKLVDFVDALDGWITKGGFLPSDWNKA
jgi:hypothetical protein